MRPVVFDYLFIAFELQACWSNELEFKVISIELAHKPGVLVEVETTTFGKLCAA
jgi:hypothetical protein